MLIRDSESVRIRSAYKPLKLGTIPILRQQRNWVGGIRKMTFLLIFSTFYTDVGWVGKKKSKNLLT